MNLEKHRENLKFDEMYANYAYVTKEDLELLNHPQFYKDLGIDSSSDDDDDEEPVEKQE
jgi:hypothetical protein